MCAGSRAHSSHAPTAVRRHKPRSAGEVGGVDQVAHTNVLHAGLLLVELLLVEVELAVLVLDWGVLLEVGAVLEEEAVEEQLDVLLSGGS